MFFGGLKNIKQTIASLRGDCAAHFRVPVFVKLFLQELLITGIIYKSILDSVLLLNSLGYI